MRAAVEVGDEVRRWLPSLAAKRRLDLNALLSAFQVLPVRWLASDVYGWLEPWARKRMAGRDEDDWPTAALAMALTLSDDTHRVPVLPRIWLRHLPEATWPIAFGGWGRRTSVAIWSQDKDLEVSGLPIWKTGQTLRAIGR